MLSEKEKYRYDRQIRLNHIGLDGQEKLKMASVLVIGAGGLGCPVLSYLAAAGVGKIGIVDFDSVNETNLHRQILFNQKDIGNNKAFSAAEKLKMQNPYCVVEPYPKRLENALALELFEHYDIVVDATDNFTTRYLVNDACMLTGKPFVYGSVFKTEGQVSVFNYKNGPSYRCLFPQPPQLIPSCEQVGVMGVLCGIIGSKQAGEIIKMITGQGDVLSGKIELYDSLRSVTTMFSFDRDEQVIAASALSKEEFLQFNYPQFCGEEPSRFLVTADQLKQLMTEKNVQIFDIRQDWEDPKLDYENVISVPLQEIEKATQLLSRDAKIVVVCQYGTRSNMAVDYLRFKHQFRDVVHLKGGVLNFTHDS